MEKDDGQGAVQLFRVVRIPFRVACVSGNLKMRLRVNQDRRTRKVSLLLEPPPIAVASCSDMPRVASRVPACRHNLLKLSPANGWSGRSGSVQSFCVLCRSTSTRSRRGGS